MSSLESAQQKVERAGHHLKEFSSKTMELIRGGLYDIVREVDGTDYVWRVVAQRPLPIELPLILGDFAQNLRSSLDHIVWELRAKAGWHDAKTERTAAFLIAETEKAFNGRRQACIGGLPQEQQDLIENFQPYRGTRAGKLLLILHELARLDRHRTIPVVVAIRKGFYFMGSGLGSVDWGDLVRERETGGIQDGEIFMRIPINLYAYVEKQPDIGFMMICTEPPQASGADINSLAGEIYRAVGDEVLPAFTDFFSNQTY